MRIVDIVINTNDVGETDWFGQLLALIFQDRIKVWGISPWIK